MIGITLQLGILGIAGRAMYVIRMIENVILICVITWFAFDKRIDCEYCSDPETRHPFKNERVLTWLIIGWISITIHIASSFIVSTLIKDDYTYNFATIVEQQAKKYKSKQANVAVPISVHK